MKLIPKKWSEFQHYKDRLPPWIKLHHDLLRDRDFMCLPLASKAIAPLLWLLASESKEGIFDADMDELVFRLHLTEKEIASGLKPLMDKGFFLNASTMLADCYQVAIPETETETETETKANLYSNEFDSFWKAYDKPVGKANAFKIWKSIKPDGELVKTILHKATLQAKNTERKFRKDAERWLRDKRWEDEIAVKPYNDIF